MDKYNVMPSDIPEDPTGGDDWRAEWRQFLGREHLASVEAELDAAEARILEELAPDGAAADDAAPAAEWRPSTDDVDDPLAAVAIAIINQGLTIPLGHGSVRLLEDRVMFGVALPLDEARALVTAWTELSNGDGDGSAATPAEAAIASLLASLLDPLAMRMLDEDGGPDLED